MVDSPGLSARSRRFSPVEVCFSARSAVIRQMQGLSVRPATPADEDELERLITDHFGPDADYTVAVHPDDPDRVVRVAADESGTLVGVMGLTVCDTQAAVGEEMYLVETTDPVPPAERYGLLEMGYTRDGYAGRGIGSRLLDRLHEAGRERDVALFLADAWFHGGPDSPEPFFERHGYEVRHRRSMAGHADGDCSKCGPDCVCEAALVARPGTD